MQAYQMLRLIGGKRPSMVPEHSAEIQRRAYGGVPERPGDQEAATLAILRPEPPKNARNSAFAAVRAASSARALGIRRSASNHADFARVIAKMAKAAASRSPGRRAPATRRGSSACTPRRSRGCSRRRPRPHVRSVAAPSRNFRRFDRDAIENGQFVQLPGHRALLLL